LDKIKFIDEGRQEAKGKRQRAKDKGQRAEGIQSKI
jgi:hypothetical protein